MSRPAGGWTDEFLDRMRMTADPLADQVALAIIERGAAAREKANELFLNINLNSDTAALLNIDHPPLRKAAIDYFKQSAILPDWADPKLIHGAEQLFYNHAMLSTVVLFNASLPECYVLPSVAEVLHIAGNLEDRALHRIRQTARMIFPVMAAGGLTTPGGQGVPQVQKVRLIHASIRCFLLGGNPVVVARQVAAGEPWRVPSDKSQPRTKDLLQAMERAHWDVQRDGLPVNQAELAYVLLTFSHVFNTCAPKLGVRLKRDEQLAFLHCWNVVGHILGIPRDLMADTPEEAEELYEISRRRAKEVPPRAADPRPELGAATVTATRSVLPLEVLKPWATLLPQRLCEPWTVQTLALTQPVPLWEHIAYFVTINIFIAIEWFARWFITAGIVPKFVHNLFRNVLLKGLFMSETLPLRLPDGRLNPELDRISSASKKNAWVAELESRKAKSSEGQVSSRGH